MAYNIISVEDDPQIAELLRFVLQHDDLTVHFAHDGLSGLNMIRSMQPDLILLDVMLPELGGWEIYDTIRSEEALCRIPVIMVSVVAEIRERKAAFAVSTIDSYFTKPFDTRRLRLEIEHMLGVTLWDMPNLPPVRHGSAADVPIPPLDPALADLFQSTSRTDEAPVDDLDDTQPALPLRPLRPSRPARREDPVTDRDSETNQADSAAQHGEASADT